MGPISLFIPEICVCCTCGFVFLKCSSPRSESMYTVFEGLACSCIYSTCVHDKKMTPINSFNLLTN